MELTDKQYDGHLIDDYVMLKGIRKLAEAENASETVKAIDERLAFIKAKLYPTKLPEQIL